MKIAVVHSFYESGQPSGENSVVRDQVEALGEAGHDVALIARETDALQSEHLYKLRSAFAVMTGRGPDPTAQLARFRPDVVHVHNTFPNWGTSGLGVWVPRIVVTVHNFRPLCAAATLFRDGSTCTDCLRTPVLPALAHACYRGSRLASLPLAISTRPGGPMLTLLRRASAVTVLNEPAREVFERALGRDVHVTPNFVDALQSRAGGPRHGWVYVGRFTPEKGVVELIRSWPEGESLDVVGAGPAQAKVEAAARIRSDVRLLPSLDRTELRSRLGSYEGLVVPSRWAEGLPTVLLEALAAGTPAVVSKDVSTGPALQALGVAVCYDAALGTEAVRRAVISVRAQGGRLNVRAREVHREYYSREAWLAAITAIYSRVAAAADAVRG